MFLQLPLQGALVVCICFTQGDALGYGKHWAFSPYWLCTTLGFLVLASGKVKRSPSAPSCINIGQNSHVYITPNIG